MPESAASRYRAFLSYAHADVRTARWLHRSLESYRIDQDLIGRETARGQVPKSLRPIFLDREDFVGGETLDGATSRALNESDALIVLCSTTAAGRPAVQEEARVFRAQRPERPVMPVILEGSPPECFPPALRFEVSPDGTVTDRPVIILAPDLRDGHDGRELALAKIVASLLGVPVDDIVRRAERDRRRRLRSWVAGLASITVAMAGLAGFAEVQRREAEKQRGEAVAQRQEAEAQRQEAVTQREAAERNLQAAEHNFQVAKQAADALVKDITRGLKDVKGMSAASVQKVLGRAEAAFDQLAAGAQEDERLLSSRAAMYNEFVEVYLAVGNTEAAAAAARKSVDAAKRRVASSGASETRRELAMGLLKSGDTLQEVGDRAGARRAYEESLAIRESLHRDDPSNDVANREVAIALVRLGEIDEAEESFAAAEDRYRKSLEIRQGLAQKDPKFRREVLVGQISLGDALLAQKPLRSEAAGNAFDAAVSLARTLRAEDENSTNASRDLALALQRLGNLALESRKAEQAEAAYKESKAIYVELSSLDPDNVEWRRDVAISMEKLAQVEKTRGNKAKSRALFLEVVTLRRQLSRVSPDNDLFQEDLVEVLKDLAPLCSKAVALRHLGEARGLLLRIKQRSSLGERRQRWLDEIEQQLGVATKASPRSAPPAPL
jgi:tetratricopeptide (TPR) repeat protein